jgi:TolB protein
MASKAKNTETPIGPAAARRSARRVWGTSRSVLLSGAAVAVVACVLVGAVASRAGIRGRAGTIAFLRGDVGVRAGLFAIKADGSSLRRLTPSSVDVDAYEWSPDGSSLAYLDGRGALWLVRPDGAGRRLVAASSASRSPWALSWSSDGKAIAVLAQDPSAKRPTDQKRLRRLRIVVVPVDGGAPRRLPSGDAVSLDWSPGGDEIAYAGAGTRTIRSDGSNARPFFSPPPAQGNALPSWSPDGTQIGFVGFGGAVRRGRYTDRYAGIYVADADGRNLHLVTNHAYNEYGFAWSPDGRSIVYGRANRGGIYVIGSDGRNNERLTRDSPRPVQWGALTWASDGRSIAYATDRTGNGDIYVIGVDGHNNLRLTSSAADDIDPSWQPQ